MMSFTAESVSWDSLQASTCFRIGSKFRYGVKLKKSGKEFRGRCPIHQGDGTDTFHVRTEKNAFHCFSCQAKGNVLDLVAAMEKFLTPPVFEREKISALNAKLSEIIEAIDGCELVSSKINSLANTVAFVVRGADGIGLLAGLDVEGICASSGSACSAGSIEPSHVILAIDRKNLSNSLVRFSLGRDSTPAEVDFVCLTLPEIIRRAQLGK